MNEAFIKNIRVLKKAIAERKLVVFAGAGISIDSGVPSWSELINDLRNEINIPANETDFLRIAQMYYNERQQKEFIDKVRESLKYKKLRYNEIHEAIFELNPEHILTTNFDDLLEQVIKSKAYPFSVIKKDNEFPYGRNTKLVVKIHGDLDEANLVIKEDDYLEYSSNHPLIESFIKGVFANKVVLFIGYSFSDINFKIILQSVRNILGPDFQNAYMLTTEGDFHPAKRQYLKNKGINVIDYEDAGKIYEQNAIEQYLFVGRNALNYPLAEKNNSLSEKGAKLFHLIKFITKYLDFPESIIKDDIVTQMHKSLYRFCDVRVLPATFLGNLFPFNNHKRYIHNYCDGILGSNNNQVTKFFFEELDAENVSIKENFFSNNSIHISNKNQLNSKWIEINEKLNFASVFFFGKSNSKLELFEYPHQLDEKIELKIINKYCSCLSCLYNDLKIQSFLKDLKEASITETSEIKNDLLVGYSNYKAGNFKTSYTQFEEIANKAWQLGKYISYYIAKQNVKYLRNMISWRDDNISNENKKRIVEKIDDIDLDKLLFQIPNLDDDEYKLLKMIRDDEVLIDAENEINEYHNKIVEIYNGYKRGGYRSSGPYYPFLISERLHKLFYFYTYNYIVKDEYLDFKRVMQTGIKSLLICYSIDEKYSQKLRTFDFSILRFIILYESDASILETFKNYSIKTLKIDEGSIPKAIQFLNNIFQSGFTESNILGRKVELNSDLSLQTRGYFFQDTFRTLTHNTLIVFAGIEIPSEYSEVIIRNFLDFLKTQTILFWHSEKYLNKFLINIKDYFAYENFIELLQIYIETKADYANEDYFRIIGFGLKNKYLENTINDTKLINEIITKYLNTNSRKDGNAFMYLWKVCSEENKIIIEEALKASLNKSFDPISYLNACYENIISPSLYFSNYIELLDRGIPKNFETWENQDPMHREYIFSNFVNLIHIKNIKKEEIPFKQWNNYPDFWKFLLNPEAFDYSEFNTKWLLIIRDESLHKKLNAIPDISPHIRESLKKEYNKDLAKLYAEFYLK